MYKVKLMDLVERLELHNLTTDIDLSEIEITEAAVNRLALQLTGFFDFFQAQRIQIVGNAEYAYIKTVPDEKMIPIYEEILSNHIPCIIFTQGNEPCDRLMNVAREKKTPILTTPRNTSEFIAITVRWLSERLAPRVSIHGVLVDVHGVGVLIMGESGVGKSEAALELIHRGHRLVSDDVVEIRKVNDEKLVGTSPEITRHFIELRGIGIVDVKSLFGVKSVKEFTEIDMVVRLEEWDREKSYDRLGLEEEYVEYLGNKIVCYSIPVRPGRNLAIILESAASNFRAKKQGYNAAQELYNRVTGRLSQN